MPREKIGDSLPMGSLPGDRREGQSEVGGSRDSFLKALLGVPANEEIPTDMLKKVEEIGKKYREGADLEK